MVNELFSANQVASMFGIHVMTVYRWIHSGRLPAKRLPGGRLRIETKELEKLLSTYKAETNGNGK